MAKPNAKELTDVADFQSFVIKHGDGLRLNIGCGTDIRDGFINIDPYSPYAEADWDAGKLPLRNDSVAVILSVMMVEHVSMPSVIPMFREWYRVLKRGGGVFIVTTNLIDVCKKTLETAEAGNPNLMYLFGSQTREGHSHGCGFTQESLIKCLTESGFMFFQIGQPDAPWLGAGYHDLIVTSEKRG